ncbi:MAG: aconitate hydratase AcnA [Spirochaetaceae bacterium]|nr:MAG: aconitate hydratase AcnA [Spirochaetaceae bacterium]
MSTSSGYSVIDTLASAKGRFAYYSLEKLEEQGFSGLSRMPASIKVLAESVVRSVNGMEVTDDHVAAFTRYRPTDPGQIEIPFMPARVLLQDFTGVPCVVDLAAMRSAMARLGGDPARINPLLPVDLVIDHSVQVDVFNSPDALKQNADIEFSRNRERYEFLRWGQRAFRNFRVVPPASGICHQVNLEYLGRVVQQTDDGATAYFDSLVGTDSHTPMINGLGVVGWGVGGIEAEAAMLGQPIYMLAPGVVGVRLHGTLRPGITATDLVLVITELLRKHGVVGRFVEFFGAGLSQMSVPDRATISNMAPEYGATIGYFPVDDRTLQYLHATGRDEGLIDLVERYTKAQGVFRTDDSVDPEFQEVVDLDLSTVAPSVAGPKRPQDRVPIDRLKEVWNHALRAPVKERGYELGDDRIGESVEVTYYNGEKGPLRHGDVVIAAITSCTNTSNPSVLLGAGLLAKKAVEAGLATKPWVKTSFAPGSVVVTEYLIRAGLMHYLEKLGFYLVGYGCTTCIGNSGPIPPNIATGIDAGKLVAAGVLSGNRNFEGRINPHAKANFLASPPLVVAYGLAGTVNIDLDKEPIGTAANGTPVYLADIWPDDVELAEYVAKALDRDAFLNSYAGIEESNDQWNAIPVSATELYPWDGGSTYVQEPPFFTDMKLDVERITAISNARVLVIAGDSTTTDHISPAGSIDPSSPAGVYLGEHGVDRSSFNSYGSRRGNDQIMTRGTFANIRFRNLIAPGTEGSRTIYLPSGEETDIYTAGERYRDADIPTLILAGKDYGMGSSRDWAAKGTYLLGVRAVIAESFERIHRSNLVGMGVLPLEFLPGESVERLGLSGREVYTIAIDDAVRPRQQIEVSATDPEGGSRKTFSVVCRIDSPVEIDYYRNGGILQTVLRRFVGDATA